MLARKTPERCSVKSLQRSAAFVGAAFKLCCRRLLLAHPNDSRFAIIFLCITEDQSDVSCVLILILKLQCLLFVLKYPAVRPKVNNAPDKYSGFLKIIRPAGNYHLRHGKTGVAPDPHFNDSNYDSIVLTIR